VLQGTLTVGSLLVVIAYLAAVYNPLSSIAPPRVAAAGGRERAARARDDGADA
jgi:hypothetical protein